MYDVCVAYLLSQSSDVECVLLGEKRRGLGSGKVVAPGGKLEPGESPRDAVVREVREETGIDLADVELEQVAVIEYRFPTKSEWNQRSFVFRAQGIDAEPSDTTELAARWCPTDDVPYDRMWSDAQSWVPAVLSGKTGIHRAITFGPDLSTVSDNAIVIDEDGGNAE